MKIAYFLFLILLTPINLGAQTSNDYWDKTFNPKKYQAKQQQRIQEWFKSWSTRRCETEDIKAYWLLTLLEPVPGSTDRRYNDIVRQNDKITAAIKLGAWDFEAQDSADQLNIAALRANKKEAEATAIEQLRVQRRAIYEQRLQADRGLAEQRRSNAIISSELRRLNDNILLLGYKIPTPGIR